MKKNNYRVYHDLKTGKLVFMPHGMDQMWWERHGALQPPFAGLLARKLILTTEGKERYQAALKEMLDKVHKTKELHQQIDAILARFEQHLKPVDKGLYDDIVRHAQELKDDIKAREEFVRKQLKS